MERGRKEGLLPQGGVRGGLLGLFTPRPTTLSGLARLSWPWGGLGKAGKSWEEGRKEGKKGIQRRIGWN